MDHVAENIHKEFWRPASPSPRPVEVLREIRSHVEPCHSCGTEFVIGARFCHVCGAVREPAVASVSTKLSQALDFSRISQALGLSAGSLVAFFVGVVCVVAAIVTGMMYSAKTLLDWQAIQMWRLEWLLAAVAAFAAGILLKRN